MFHAGMGATLRIASETGVYTLTYRATFAQLAPRLGLIIVCEGGDLLLNTYAVIVPSSGPLQVQATAFADCLSEGNPPLFSVSPSSRKAELQGHGS